MNSPEVIAKTPRELDPKRDWKEFDVRQRMRKWFVVLVTAIGVISLGLIGWVLFAAPIAKAEVIPLATGVDLTLVLAPVLAAAAGVERLLETIFNVMEGAWRTMVAYLGFGLRWLKSAESEVEQARQWLSNTTNLYTTTLRSYNEKLDQFLKDVNAGTIPLADLPEEVQRRLNALTQEATLRTSQVKDLLQEAERRLGDAESKLAGVTSSADYVGAKTAASIILGLMFGVIVAAVGQLQMFALLGIKAVPERIDVLITGLIIGSGSNPVHSLIGILQQGKDTLDSVKGFFNRSAPQGQATEQRLTTIQPSNIPGEQPIVRQAVIATTTAQTTEATPNP